MAEKANPAELLRSAMAWAHRVITISLSMALPPLGGFWLDSKLGTGFLFVVIGALLGFTLGVFQLLQLAKQPEQETRQDENLPNGS